MIYLPTFVRRALDQYSSKSASTDASDRYRALEAVYAATIKYIGTAAAVAARQHLPTDERNEVWSPIFASSSLGGWLQATDRLCACSSRLPKRARMFFSEFNDYKKHPARGDLDEIRKQINSALGEVRKKGYEIEPLAKSASLLRALGGVVAIRNKQAHGCLGSDVLHAVQNPLHIALKVALHRIPFGDFVLWAAYGNSSLELRGHTPRAVSRRPKAPFWVESRALECGSLALAPFAEYDRDAGSVFLLNDKIAWEKDKTEYIDYASGDVRYWEAPVAEWHEVPVRAKAAVAPADVAQSRRYLKRLDLSWRPVPLTKDSLPEVDGLAGVYVFAAASGVGVVGDTILYVGRSRTNMADRLKSYLRIRGGYDVSRPEIGHMFQSYPDLRLLFTPTEDGSAARLERAIFDATGPRYNQIAPPVGGVGGDA